MKLKGRCVAGGHRQIRSASTSTSSPTVALTSVFAVITIAAHKRWEVVTVDITGAYLNAPLNEDVFMRLDPYLTDILVEISDEYIPFIRESGDLIVRLKKALYGLIQSSKLWYECLRDAILEYGFIMNPEDHCVFRLDRGKVIIILCVYVDDLLITSNSPNDIAHFNEFLRYKFKSITVNVGLIHSYLGMTLDFNPNNAVEVSMKGYIKQLLIDYNIQKLSPSPASNTLFDQSDDHVLLSESENIRLHSGVAKLLYLSTRIRPDIQLAVNYLCTRVNCYTATTQI
jgi:hypothetical protein